MSSLQQDQPVVLVVDSDPLTMTGMAAILHMQGYECHCAQSYDAAIKAAETLELDLVVCEVALNDGSGVELCQQIHNAQGDDLPVIFLASTPLPAVIRQVESTPSVYFLRKPFDPKLLIQTAENAVWFPHLVQSNLAAEATQPKAGQQVGIESGPTGQQTPRPDLDVHRHASTPAPKRKTTRAKSQDSSATTASEL